LTSGVCRSKTLCPANLSPVCPVITLPNITSSAVAGGASVVVRSNVNLLAGTYHCLFGSINATGVRIGSTNDISCTVPASPNNTDGNVALQLLYQGTSFTPDSIPFEYYGAALLLIAPSQPSYLLSLFIADCLQKVACFECITPTHPECRFCLNDLSCVYETSNPCGGGRNCPGTSTSPPMTTHTHDLPSITELTNVSPPSLYLGDSALLFVSGTFPGAPSLPNLTCYFGAVYGHTNVTSQTNSTIQCNTPVGLSVGNIAVSVYSNGIPFTNSISFTVYGTIPTISSSSPLLLLLRNSYNSTLFQTVLMLLVELA